MHVVFCSSSPRFAVSVFGGRRRLLPIARRSDLRLDDLADVHAKRMLNLRTGMYLEVWIWDIIRK